MSFSLLLLWLVPLVVGLWAFSNGRRDLHYPALLAWIYLAWVVPQAISVEKTGVANIYEPGFLWLYAMFCFLFALTGFYLGKNRKIKNRRWRPIQFNETRLVISAAGLILIGIISLAMTVRTVQAQALGSEWTGIATFFYLISSSSYLGLAIAGLLFARKPTWFLALIIVIGLIGIMPAVVTLVKRNVLFELAMIGAGSLFFVRRYVPPRPLVFGAMIVGTMLIHQVGEIRNYLREDRGTVVDAVVEGVLWEDFAYFDMDRAYELTQASVDIYTARQAGHLEWGAEYWNKLVHQYVPSFLVGSELKSNLKVDTRRHLDEIAVEDFVSRGATRTGFSDSFRSFQIFGALVFGVIGFVMGWLYRAAIHGSFISSFLYIIMLNDALFGVTESTARFISQIPFIAVVTIGVIIFSRKYRPRPTKHIITPAMLRPRPAATENG